MKKYFLSVSLLAISNLVLSNSEALGQITAPTGNNSSSVSVKMTGTVPSTLSLGTDQTVDFGEMKEAKSFDVALSTNQNAIITLKESVANSGALVLSNSDDIRNKIDTQKAVGDNYIIPTLTFTTNDGDQKTTIVVAENKPATVGADGIEVANITPGSKSVTVTVSFPNAPGLIAGQYEGKLSLTATAQ